VNGAPVLVKLGSRTNDVEHGERGQEICHCKREAATDLVRRVENIAQRDGQEQVQRKQHLLCYNGRYSDTQVLPQAQWKQ
jgi:hypothetical protein